MSTFQVLICCVYTLFVKKEEMVGKIYWMLFQFLNTGFFNWVLRILYIYIWKYKEYIYIFFTNISSRLWLVFILLTVSLQRRSFSFWWSSIYDFPCINCAFDAIFKKSLLNLSHKSFLLRAYSWFLMKLVLKIRFSVPSPVILCHYIVILQGNKKDI